MAFAIASKCSPFIGPSLPPRPRPRPDVRPGGESGRTCRGAGLGRRGPRVIPETSQHPLRGWTSGNVTPGQALPRSVVLDAKQESAGHRQEDEGRAVRIYPPTPTWPTQRRCPLQIGGQCTGEPMVEMSPRASADLRPWCPSGRCWPQGRTPFVQGVSCRRIGRTVRPRRLGAGAGSGPCLRYGRNGSIRP